MVHASWRQYLQLRNNIHQCIYFQWSSRGTSGIRPSWPRSGYVLNPSQGSIQIPMDNFIDRRESQNKLSIYYAHVQNGFCFTWLSHVFAIRTASGFRFFAKWKKLFNFAIHIFWLISFQFFLSPQISNPQFFRLV